MAAGELTPPQVARATTTADPMERALVDAMHSAVCLSAPAARQALYPTVSLAYTTHFLPNTGYTAHLVSLPDSQVLSSLSPVELAQKALADGKQHYAWQFTTSRYATFSEHVLAHEGLTDWILHDPPAAGYAAEITKALGAVTSAPRERRDTKLLEHILYALLRCEALPPAQRPGGYRLWLESPSPQGPAWQCLGLLLDSPEPLFRPGCTRLDLTAESGNVSFALALSEQGTRALIWAPGLHGQEIHLKFTLKKQAIPPDGVERSESRTLLTYVLEKPGAYLEEN